MNEKFIMTSYDRDEMISMIREVFQEQLTEILDKQEKESDYDQLLSRKEAAELLKVSDVTISKYKREGMLQFYKLGRRVYYKKGDIMKAIEINLKYQHRRFNY